MSITVRLSACLLVCPPLAVLFCFIPLRSPCLGHFISCTPPFTYACTRSRLHVHTGLSNKHEPMVTVNKCSAGIGHLKIKFHGGASWLYNLFSHFIAGILLSWSWASNESEKGGGMWKMRRICDYV